MPDRGLLGDHDDIAVGQRLAGAIQRLANQQGEIVARLDQRDAGQRGQLQSPWGHATALSAQPPVSVPTAPVMRRPEPSIL